MVVAVIGMIALVASIKSWFLPGIGLGLGLILLGIGLALMRRGPQESR